jgi:hypothetical protein
MFRYMGRLFCSGETPIPYKKRLGNRFVLFFNESRCYGLLLFQLLLMGLAETLVCASAIGTYCSWLHNDSASSSIPNYKVLKPKKREKDYFLCNFINSDLEIFARSTLS